MENQSKVKKILMSVWLAVATVLSVIFIIVCIVGGVHNSKKEKQNASACIEFDIIAYNINNDINKGIVKPISKNVVYNDDDLSITFSAYELNNYVYSNLRDYIVSQYASTIFNGTYVYIGSDEYAIDTSSVDTAIYYGNVDYIAFYLGSNYDDVGRFIYNNGEDDVLFSDSLLWDLSTVDSSLYLGIKSSIQLDIEANTQTINDSVFETLSSSTVGFIGTISSGITSILAVFYSDNALTVIGTLSVIVVAVGLAYFLFRLIFGLIRMRG